MDHHLYVEAFGSIRLKMKVGMHSPRNGDGSQIVISSTPVIDSTVPWH
jgi:hypothetical protein